MAKKMALVNIDKEEKKYYSIIISYVGLIALYTGFTLLIPLLLLIAFPEELHLAPSFLLSSILSVLTGFSLWHFFKCEKNISFDLRHSTVIVTFGWILAVLFGSLPFYFSGEMSFLNSIFEATSGWTTTGLTMVVIENQVPNLLLFWRSLMQFIGGAGLAVLMLTAVVGSTDIESGMFISEAKEDKLIPSIAGTTKLIAKIYVGYVVVGTLLYILLGMGWFDAINHSMCAFATGGFSTKDSSLGAFSVKIQVITLLFMFFGNLNFALHYELLKGNLKELFLDIEPRTFFKISIISIPLIFFSIHKLDNVFSYSLLHSVFQSISAFTGTGYMTQGADVLLGWGGLPLLILATLMLLGASAGSTGGGLKQLRVGVILKSVFWEFKKRILPKRAVIDTSFRHIGKDVMVNKEDMWSIITFTTVFLSFYLFGVIVFLLHGYSLEESVFEFASAQATVGLTVEVTGPNMPNILKVVEIFGMWLGRLEFWTVFTGILSVYRDLRR
ncbi:cation transporter [archaeon SCG-AAA382B04]|nr:cation transporter [archaeon SCG-AAA382B04]